MGYVKVRLYSSQDLIVHSSNVVGWLIAEDGACLLLVNDKEYLLDPSHTQEELEKLFSSS